MDKEVDLEKYQIRTDLAIEELEDNIKIKGIKHNIKKIDNITITSVELDEINELNKKKGKYITLEFDDITDNKNRDLSKWFQN